MFDAKEYMRTYSKELRRLRREGGLCVQCGEPSDGKASCPECRKKYAESHARRFAEMDEKGVCRMCCQKPVGENGRQCDECREKAKEAVRKNYRKSSEKGVCVSCGGEKDRAGKRCSVCHQKQLEGIKAYRQRNFENGRCRECGRKANLSPRTGLCSHTPRTGVRYCRCCYLKVMAGYLLGSQKHWRILLAKLREYDWRCAYSGERLRLGDNVSFDHMDPVKRFPEKKSNPDNLVPCTLAINLMKRDMTRAEFLDTVRRIAEFSLDVRT